FLNRLCSQWAECRSSGTSSSLGFVKFHHLYGDQVNQNRILLYSSNQRFPSPYQTTHPIAKDEKDSPEPVIVAGVHFWINDLEIKNVNIEQGAFDASLNYSIRYQSEINSEASSEGERILNPVNVTMVSSNHGNEADA